MTYVHVHAPKYTVSAHVIHCPTCDRQRRMMGLFAEWYGITLTCAGCGDMWTDGERHERPFSRGWRRQNIEYARNGLAEIGVQA